MAKRRRKSVKSKRATSHSDFAGKEPDVAEMRRLTAEAEKANTAKPVDPDLIRHHIKLIAAAAAISAQAKATAASKRKILTNRYKAAGVDGMDIAALKRAFIIAELPIGEVVTEERNLGLYLRCMDVEIGHQWSLFDSPEIDIKAQGEHAGKNGEGIESNPHKPGTEEYMQWLENYQKGEASIAQSMGPPN
jgi:hypothetical protein